MLRPNLKTHAILTRDPPAVFYPTIITTIDSTLPYSDQIWTLLRDHVDVKNTVKLLNVSALLSVIGYIGPIIVRSLPRPKMDVDEMSALSVMVIAHEPKFITSYGASMHLISECFVTFHLLPYAIASRTLPSTLLPFFWIVAGLSAAVQACQTVYNCYIAYESPFIR